MSPRSAPTPADGLVSFPHFWYGPAWLEINGPGGERNIRLTWGDWYRQLHIEPPALLWFTCAAPDVPLRITADSDLHWSVGVGMRDGAVPINQNWTPVSIDVAQRALFETEHAFARAMRRRQSTPSP